MGGMRSMKRQLKKNKGELTMKKAVARSMGISLEELNQRFFKKDKERRNTDDR